jgi:hypothetical protein
VGASAAAEGRGRLVGGRVMWAGATVVGGVKGGVVWRSEGIADKLKTITAAIFARKASTSAATMPKRFEAAILRLQVRDAVLSHDSLADMLQKVEAMEKEEKEREKAEHEENERVRRATQEPARDEDIKRK